MSVVESEVRSGKKRKVDVVVISDVHLGTYGCHAKELLRYMKSIKPNLVILNGDIIDIWQFSKRYWPKSHMKVIHHLSQWMSKGVKVCYIPGNHDEMLRKFTGFKLGSFSIENKLLLDLDGKKAWIFHGDVFDATMQHAKWLAKLGATGYDLLILINTLCNWVSVNLGKGKISLSKNIKNSVKSAVKFINNFEKTCTDIAIEKKYDYVLCGHIHHPEMKTVSNEEGSVLYLNSGDWIENLTALEYQNGEWSVFKYNENEFSADEPELHQEEQLVEMKSGEIFNQLLCELNFYDHMK